MSIRCSQHKKTINLRYFVTANWTFFVHCYYVYLKVNNCKTSKQKHWLKVNHCKTSKQKQCQYEKIFNICIKVLFWKGAVLHLTKIVSEIVCYLIQLQKFSTMILMCCGSIYTKIRHIPTCLPEHSQQKSCAIGSRNPQGCIT